MNSNTIESDQDFRMWWLIQQTRKILYTARAKELFQYGLTPEEAGVLFVIDTLSNRGTPTEIARWLFRKPQSTFGLLKRMGNKGLVKMLKDLDRKNMVRVTMTEKGRQAYSLAAKRESIRRMLAVLSEEERQQLESNLKKLRENAITELTMAQKPFLPPI